MFIIDNWRIKLTKGDTATILVSVFDADGNAYSIQSTDTITMTVKKAGSSTASISKTATSEHYIILNHSDTANLNVGLYQYDIQLTTNDGAIYTIVPSSIFELTEEITA